MLNYQRVNCFTHPAPILQVIRVASRSEALQKRGAAGAEGGQVPQVPPKEVPRQLHQGKRLVLLDPEKPEELQRMKSETWQEMVQNGPWPRLGSMDLQGSMFFLGGPECLEFLSSFGGKVQSKQGKNNYDYDEEIRRFLADDLWIKVECDFGWCSAGAVDFPFGPCVILRTCWCPVASSWLTCLPTNWMTNSCQENLAIASMGVSINGESPRRLVYDIMETMHIYI